MNPIVYENLQINSSAKKLSLLLRESIEAKHDQVRNTQFVQNLMARAVTKETYQQYLADLFAIYTALEAAIWEKASDANVGPLLLPELFRKDKIAKDLQAFGVMGLPATASGRAYAEHINTLKESAPHRLIAHAYARYLGDLFGGQAIGGIVAAQFGNEVIAFYDFNELIDSQKIRAPQMYVRTLRNIMDALPLSQREAEEVVEEAGFAFDFAKACMEELN